MEETVFNNFKGIYDALLEKVTRVENSALEAADKARTMDKSSQGFFDVAKDMARLAGNLRKALEQHDPEKLTDPLKQISFFRLMMKVAAQANILAINAAIELVRVGRDVKEFNKVTREIKALSQEIQSAVVAGGKQMNVTLPAKRESSRLIGNIKKLFK